MKCIPFNAQAAHTLRSRCSLVATLHVIIIIFLLPAITHAAECKDKYKVKYQEGVDAKGYAVPPADLQPTTGGFKPDKVDVFIAEPLKGRLKNPEAYNTNLDESRIGIGKIEVPLKDCP